MKGTSVQRIDHRKTEVKNETEQKQEIFISQHEHHTELLASEPR